MPTSQAVTVTVTVTVAAVAGGEGSYRTHRPPVEAPQAPIAAAIDNPGKEVRIAQPLDGVGGYAGSIILTTTKVFSRLGSK